ncbi:MAG TPA: ABC transporter permease [Phycisphaerae bacterium]|nr:ABC transporter permease [Phycisphaerae bacterium]
MSGFHAFLHKEFLEITRTWRIWVVPGMILFFAVASPILALATPALVASIAGSQPGIMIKVPEATAVDAYQQYLKNLNQLILIAIIISSAGCISGEVRGGTTTLVLTKPLSRTGFVLAKIVSQQVLLTASTIVGAGLCVLVTALLFGRSPVPYFLGAVFLWLLYALWMIVVMTLLSVLFVSQGGASGVGFGVYLLIALLSAWSPVAKFSPAGLISGASRILSGIRPDILPAAAVTILLALVFAALAVQRFRCKEL